MKKIFCLILAFSFLAFFGFGQQDDAPMRGNNIQGLKIAFVTKQLSLTTDEAQKFWPVYYSYLDEMKKARSDRKDDVLLFEESVLNIRKKFRTDFKKVLNTDERVNKALTIDRDFNNELRKELQKRVQQRKKVDLKQ